MFFIQFCGKQLTEKTVICSELSCTTTRKYAATLDADGWAEGSESDIGRQLGTLAEAVRQNSRKSVRWSAVPVPCLSRLCLKLEGKQGSGPKGVDDLCFTHMGNFLFLLLLLLLLLLHPPPFKLQCRGPNSSFKAQILASRPKS